MTWMAPPVERTTQLDSLGTATGRQMLEGWLDWHRETLLAKCTGLEPDLLARTTVEPSSLTLLGLVREYARHNGHADFLRERTDGATGD
jgi:hypothetical protein